MKTSTLSFGKTLVLLCFLISISTFSQTTGDFRSLATGNWETLSTWETWNGSSWIAATSLPGQNNGTYKVTVQAAHTVVINTYYTSANMGDVEVFGVLNLVAVSNPKTVTLNTALLDIRNGGELRFDNQKVDLYLPTNAVLAIQTGGSITGACSNNTEIFIGTRLIAVCNGGGGGVLTFGEIVAGGGTLNANIDNPADNSVFFINTSVNLQGSYSGTATAAVTYSGFITDPSGTTTSYLNITSIPSYTFTQVGQYILSFTVATTVSGSPYSNTETHTVTVIQSDPRSTIYYENFDENNGSWTASTGSSTNWSHGTGLSAASESGEGSYWYSNSYNNYADNAYTTVESPIISTFGYNNLKFSADIRYNCNSDSDDGMIVQYRKRTAGIWSSWTILGSSGAANSTNWYDGSGNVDAIALGSDGWTGDNSSFETAIIDLPTTLHNSAEIQFRFVFASDASSTDDGVAMDNVLIYADPIIPFSDPTYGPGSVTSNLKLWLKATSEIGSTTNGANIITWDDSAFDNHSIATTANSPSFEDNATENINFNPVIKFDRSNTEFMRGKGGFYSHDYFVVIKSNGTIDYNAGNRQVPLGGRVSTDNFISDGTGLGLGNISARFSNEVVAHMSSSVPVSPTPASDQNWGKALTSTSISYLDEVIIYNVKTDAAHTTTEIYKNGVRIDNTIGTATAGGNLNFSEFINQQYYVGVGRFSLNGNVPAYVDGKINEIISFADTNSDLNQQKILSYLAIKNGITLHDSNSVTSDNLNDTDYLDSAGNVIWDTSANSGYNYDVAGIGRDDASELNQKQSKSVNETSDGTGLLTGILTMGLTDISATNSANTNTFATDKEYLVWGNNGADLNLAATAISVNMSAGITPALSTPVSFIAMQRVWKVVETTTGDLPKVKVSIPKNAVRNITPPGSYLMFISDTGVFDPTADYRVMTEDGSGNLETDYDFDGTKYITFGYAPQVVVERSVYFDGVVDYIDMENNLDLNPTEFTISAWIKRDTGSVNASILSKRNATYTEGYDFKINSTGKLQFVLNGGAATLTSSVSIPENEWHEVAVIYSSGTATLYIDGVPDTNATGLPAPIATNQSFYIAAAGKNTPTAHFKGNIDEVRIWNVALTEDQLHYIMNQEIIDILALPSPTLKQGDVIPTTITKNELSSIPWSDLAGYYPMSVYTYTNTDDLSGNSIQGALRNLNTVDYQTAPLPYESENNGDWTTDATWLNNAVQTLPNDLSIVDGTTPIDWNIVETNHNITIDTEADLGRNRKVLALMVNTGEIEIKGITTASTGNALTVTHYLKLDGSIDLQGESQLIQTDKSFLEVGANGSLQQDQQGTADTYTYNYWSSPVGLTNITANNDTHKSNYTISTILKDGTTPSTPGGISFLGGYNGTASPFGIANYWIWKFADLPDGDYSSWQHMKSTGTILAGEGYTMKGPGTGGVTTDQNYVFTGKPNNGDITLGISANNDYLIGNPYPSAIDADEFINDNPQTSGTLYFWEHWGGGSHYLKDYQGGYALYNLSGGIPAVLHPGVGTGGTPTKLPGQYIPVSQGFFVYSATGGTITFENDQRIYRKESSGNSTFMRSASNTDIQPVIDYNEDDRMKFRIGFNSTAGIHRQILLTIDQNATNGIDWGYDGKLNENQIEDMYWMIEDVKHVIQGTNSVIEETIFPLGIHVNDDGLNYITIDHLENVPDDAEIYVHDYVLNTNHDLRAGDFEVNLTAGEYLDRFAIAVISPEPIIEESEVIEAYSSFEIFYHSDSQHLIIHNPDLLEFNNLELYNILGQTIYSTKEIETEYFTSSVEVPNLSTGTYIVNLNTVEGKISKKVLVK